MGVVAKRRIQHRYNGVLTRPRIEQILQHLTFKEEEVLRGSPYSSMGTFWGNSHAAQALVSLDLLEECPQARGYYRITNDGEQVLSALKKRG
jgi:hypothetical protein